MFVEITGSSGDVFAEHALQRQNAVLGGPLLPILLLAIPVAMAVIVLLAGIISWLRPATNLPRAIVVATQNVRDPR